MPSITQNLTYADKIWPMLTNVPACMDIHVYTTAAKHSKDAVEHAFWEWIWYVLVCC